jgi:hypothetical protein
MIKTTHDTQIKAALSASWVFLLIHGNQGNAGSFWMFLEQQYEIVAVHVLQIQGNNHKKWHRSCDSLDGFFGGWVVALKGRKLNR